MKNLIVLIGTIMLGVFIFNMIMGEEPDSLKNVAEKAMRQTLIRYSQEG